MTIGWKIKEDYIEEGSYFVINKGRQYGKTTTLKALEQYLKDEYIVLSLDFQRIGTEDFADAAAFTKSFSEMVIEALEMAQYGVSNRVAEFLGDLAEHPEAGNFKSLFTSLSGMCARALKPIVLMIDEVDSASNNQVFLDFLAQLRGYFLARDKKPIFYSVILAGVYDIKNLKWKLRPDEEHKYNSPWNIATKFTVDMSFSVKQIAAMLEEYSEMKQMLKAVLFQGKRVSYNPDLPAVSLASMFGYIINVEGSIQVANRIFEMRLYNLFLSEEELTDALYDKAQGNKSQFVSGNRLDMDLVIKKFVFYFQDIYGEKGEKFLEEQGRKLFLLYLKPIINGTGNYYIEAQTRDARRTDVIVDYLGEQFVIELKIWYGNEYNERGRKQLADYLDYYHKDRGYMISFNFNRNKKAGIQEIMIGTKTIVEAVI